MVFQYKISNLQTPQDSPSLSHGCPTSTAEHTVLRWIFPLNFWFLKTGGYRVKVRHSVIYATIPVQGERSQNVCGLTNCFSASMRSFECSSVGLEPVEQSIRTCRRIVWPLLTALTINDTLEMKAVKIGWNPSTSEFSLTVILVSCAVWSYK